MLCLLLLFYFLLANCQFTRMVEYKNGTHKEIIYNQKDTFTLALKNTFPSYNFAIVLYNCINETTHHDLLYDINDYMYYTFFPVIKTCSNNRITQLNTILYGPYHTIPCNTHCTDTLINQLEEKALEVVNYSLKQPYVVSVLIKSIDCSYLGIADINGKRMFINGLDNLLNTNILLHEWGHNLGLRHAAYKMNAYGDFTCAMGNNINTPLCFNAPHSHLLNWVNVTSINTLSLKKNKTFQTLLNTPFLINNKYYLSYYQNKVNIYQLIDNYSNLLNIYIKKNITLDNLNYSWKLNRNKTIIALTVRVL